MKIVRHLQLGIMLELAPCQSGRLRHRSHHAHLRARSRAVQNLEPSEGGEDKISR